MEHWEADQTIKNKSYCKLEGSLPANPVNDQRLANILTFKGTFRLLWNQQLFKNISLWNLQR